MELLQVFVESLDRCFENVCELDLIFSFDKVRRANWGAVGKPAEALPLSAGPRPAILHRDRRTGARYKHRVDLQELQLSNGGAEELGVVRIELGRRSIWSGGGAVGPVWVPRSRTMTPLAKSTTSYQPREGPFVSNCPLAIITTSLHPHSKPPLATPILTPWLPSSDPPTPTPSI